MALAPSCKSRVLAGQVWSCEANKPAELICSQILHLHSNTDVSPRPNLEALEAGYDEDYLTFIETAHYLSMRPLYNTRICKLLQIPVKYPSLPPAVAVVQPDLGVDIPDDPEEVSWTNHVYVFPWPPRQWYDWQAGCLALSST